jgi:mannose-6-phosphate isomerase-like protein (cupin superfamily)
MTSKKPLERRNLDEMWKGWFVGAFEPTVLSTHDVEVGVKTYTAGDYEPLHHHRIATEITLIVSGSAEMDGEVFTAGEIVVIPPGRAVDFRVLQDTVTVVVKLPGASNDKYEGELSD